METFCTIAALLYKELEWEAKESGIILLRIGMCTSKMRSELGKCNLPL